MLNRDSTISCSKLHFWDRTGCLIDIIWKKIKPGCFIEPVCLIEWWEYGFIVRPYGCCWYQKYICWVFALKFCRNELQKSFRSLYKCTKSVLRYFIHFRILSFFQIVVIFFVKSQRSLLNFGIWYFSLLALKIGMIINFSPRSKANLKFVAKVRKSSCPR